jgi:pimeloyl-ACP methyl ester carboxylesterase
MYWYGALGPINGVSKFRIGLASDKPFPIETTTPNPTVTETPTPTLTPTPTITPSPTPTMTPTPSPIPVTKVIIVPGLGGSWNQNALLKCETNSSPWTIMPKYGEDVYNPIIKALNQTNFTPLLFYYDWRRDPRDTAKLLKQFIDSNTLPKEKVYLIGHSLGGLVTRSYIEQFHNDSKISKFISVAGPQEGAINAYPAWSADVVFGDIKWQIGTTLVKIACMNYKKTGLNLVQKFIPSIQSLLPTFPYLRDTKTNKLIPINTMTSINNYLPNTLFSEPFYGIKTGSLAGGDQLTPDEFIVTNRNIIDRLLNIWSDGKPISTHMNINGDGTVLSHSAIILNSDSTTINTDHKDIISTYAGINSIFNFLGITIPMLDSLTIPQTIKEPDSALVLASQTDTLSITDKNKHTTYAHGGIIVIENPDDDDYVIHLDQFTGKTPIYIIKITANQEPTWKQYDIPMIKSKSFKFHFSHEKDLPKNLD